MISWDFINKSRKPIGLDMGHHSVRMVQFIADKGVLQIVAADRVYIDPEINGDQEKRNKAIIAAIRKMLDRGDFYGRDVVSALSNDNLMITNLRLSDENHSRAPQFLKEEAERRFEFNSENDVVNYMSAGTVQSADGVKNEWILFMAKDDIVRNHIKLLEDAQLKPVSIDAIPCALFRSHKRLFRRQRDKEETKFFIDIGSNSTSIVFGRAGKICFIKQIPIGGNKFNQQVAEKLSVSISEAENLRNSLKLEKLVDFKPDKGFSEHGSKLKCSVDASTRQVIVNSISAVSEELVKEIALCLRYYIVTFRGERVESVVLSGGEASENILHNALKRQLQIEVDIAQPFKGLSLDNITFDDEHDLLCDWTVAVGLAIKN